MTQKHTDAGSAWRLSVSRLYHDFQAFPTQKQALLGALLAVGLAALTLSVIFLHRVWAICLAASGVLLAVYTVKEKKNRRTVGASVGMAAVMLLCAALLFFTGQSARRNPEISQTALTGSADGVERSAAAQKDRTAATTAETATAETTAGTAAETTEEPAAEAATEETTAETAAAPPTTDPPTTDPPTTDPPTTDPPAAEPPPTEAPEADVRDYIVNTNTGKFHYPGCASVKKMKESNKKYVTCARDELLSSGYAPCKNCNP